METPLSGHSSRNWKWKVSSDPSIRRSEQAIGPTHFCALVRQRTYEVEDRLISRKWFPELARLLPLGPSSQEKKRRSADQSYLSLDQKLPERLHLLSCGIVHAYEDGAAGSFVRAKELGIHCSYELPIAHWATSRRLLEKKPNDFPNGNRPLKAPVNLRKS